MGRSIQLTRSELVWQTRCNSWDESDFQRCLSHLAKYKDEEPKRNEEGRITNHWELSNRERYEFLSQYTWDQICGWFENDDNEPKLEYRKYDDDDWSYSDYLTEIIREEMREENYDSDICSEDYADDYDETWDVLLVNEASDDE